MSRSAAARQIVVVMGAGPGLGFACARKFAQAGHPVALLSRSLPRLQELAGKINSELNDEGRARPYAVDASKRSEVEDVFARIESDWKGKAWVHTAIFNPGGGFVMKPFLDTTEADLKTALDSQTLGGFLFAQSFLRALQRNPDWQTPSEPSAALGNLLITGATASMKGSAKFSAFAASKFGLKALTESIAREYGPQGVHVAHFIIDGIIVTERTSSFLGDKWEPHARMEPDDIAQVYLDTALQKRSVWTFTNDLRPGPEKF